MANNHLLESLTWDIHQIGLELEKETTEDACQRRALRRLDRCLQNLEAELAMVVDQRETQVLVPLTMDGTCSTSNDSPDGSSVVDSTTMTPLVSSQSSRQMTTSDIPEALSTDLYHLYRILTDLLLGTTNDDDDSSERILNALDNIAHLYVSFDDLSLTQDQCGELLQKLVTLCGKEENDNDDTPLKAASSYLMILNDLFLKQPQDIVPLPHWAILSFLDDCVSYSLHSLQQQQTAVSGQRWEPTAVTNPNTEFFVQWRILTGFLLEATLQLFENDRNSTNNNNNSDESHKSERHSSIHALQDWMSASLQEWNPHFVDSNQNLTRELFDTIAQYAHELSEYALDALDGASIEFASQTTTTNSNDNTDPADFEIAEACVQDSLRHVTLATNLLKQMDVWNLSDNNNNNNNTAPTKHLYRLWNTISKSFVERPGVSTALNYKQEDDNVDSNNPSLVICEHLLELAQVVLLHKQQQQQQEGTANNVVKYEQALLRTFLRCLQFPHLLLLLDGTDSTVAAVLWDHLEQLIQCSSHSRQMLQATVLTLNKEYLLSSLLTTANDNSDKQGDIMAIVQHYLLPMLLDAPGKEPWDAFFLRQMEGLRVGEVTTE